ncbi:uncharacterized protein YgfB (UPF0149 family) [Streptomyces iranensis]|uniref:Uncharacterized protein YgfB (UPF0149 family) n=1 Tax=Streptomyces iranensis TaxID=576784 RepID=A0ABS4MT79_9ACTN|nr:uncharacterized protein YgfB (UPF0149 family) [Streptomyces iranensis]
MAPGERFVRISGAMLGAVCGPSEDGQWRPMTTNNDRDGRRPAHVA